jgi:hypothetical protein
MNISVKRLFFSLLLLSSVACQKTADPPLTSGEKNAIELQRIINENGIKRVYPVKANDTFPNFFPSNTGTQWVFSNGFIKINYGFEYSYNLGFLLRYAILPIYLENNVPATALILYF